jgi:AraC family transcriptional regulator
MKDRIVIRSESAVEPAAPIAPAAAFVAPWLGFVFERHEMPPSEMHNVEFVNHLLALDHSSGPYKAYWRDGGVERWSTIQPGTVALRSGQPLSRLRWDGHRSFTAISIEPLAMQRLLEDFGPPRGVELVPVVAESDTMLQLLIGALAKEIAAGLPTGKLFVDGIATALCAYLAKQYSVIGPNAEPPAQGLDPVRLQRVIDHISANLSADLTVPDLASVACLSPYHFGKAFKLSMGETVHGYVLRRRIARAKDLIKEGRTSLAEVATAAGFADQSHFTAVFRRQVGVTPKAFGQQLGQRNRG